MALTLYIFIHSSEQYYRMYPLLSTQVPYLPYTVGPCTRKSEQVKSLSAKRGDRARKLIFVLKEIHMRKQEEIVLSASCDMY